MPVSLTFSSETLFGFLTVLARISGVVVFVPLPGIKSAPEPARAVFALALTLALFSRWPASDPEPLSGARMAGWIVTEAGLGIAIGLAVAVSIEAFMLA